jgi:multiple sugar transport system ATP-binding protein
MTMADKIVVMHDGLVEQVGAPLELYDRPANRFVAGFIGSPAMNFLPGRASSGGIAITGAGHTPGAGARLEENREVILGVRPEHLEIAADGLEAEVVVVEPTGSETQVFARLGGLEIAAVFRERHEFVPGQRIRLRPRTDCLHLFDPSSGQRI